MAEAKSDAQQEWEQIDASILMKKCCSVEETGEVVLEAAGYYTHGDMAARYHEYF